MFTRYVWNYNNCNYDRKCDMASNFDWDSLKDNNANTYTNNITNTIMNLTSQFIEVLE